MKNTKTVLATLMLWSLIILVGVLIAFIFNNEYFVLRCLLISPYCYLGVKLTQKFIKE